jgi:hypothetical protein
VTRPYGRSSTADIAPALVADPRVVIWPGEAHLAYKPHLFEILEALAT